MKTKVNMGFSFSILIFIILAQIGSGVILRNISVPRFGVKGGSVELDCEFVLESDTLLVLKWYKSSKGHEEEFFRYSPGIPDAILTFPVEGVSVDLSKSSLHKVVLRNITLKTSGVYKCEVSIEGSFRTLSKQEHMEIIAPPRSEPSITGVHSAVNLGDRITGNCTSKKSKPVAALTLYVNEEKPEAHELTYYHPIQEDEELQTAVLGFDFLVDKDNRHFRFGMIRLKCIATIGNFYWVKTKNISDANIKAQLSFPGHNRLSAGVRRLGGIWEFVFICFAFIVFKSSIGIANLS